MDSKLLALFNHAKIEISSYGMHYRREMLIVNRVLPFYVMSYHKSGQAIFRINGQEYDVYPGQVILVPPGMVHDHIVERGVDTELFWWHFTFQIGGYLDALRLLGLPYISSVKNTQDFEKVFENYCQREQEALTIPGLLYEKARSFEILAILFENLLSDSEYHLSDVPEVFISILKDVIDAPSAGFSLNELSEKYYLNPTYISNRFKEYFGISPILLHRKIIIERAKTLLESGGMSVSDVAQRLGFENSQTFSRFFLQKTGIRPSKYRSTLQ